MKTKITSAISIRVLMVAFMCHILIFFIGCTSQESSDNESVYVFENVNVIDAVDGLRTAQSVVVRGNEIVEVGENGEISEPSGATVIDGSGKYMIPGLWEAHGHLSNTEAMRKTMFPLLIVNGITYFRDTSATLESILPIRQNAEEASEYGMAPRVFITGPHIDGAQTSWNSSVSVTSVDQVEPVLDTLFNVEIDEIKIYDLLSPEIFFEVLSIANSEGYNVSAHVPLAMDVVEASNAGLDAMEHMSNLEFSLSSEWEALLQERQQMIAEGTEKEGRELRADIYEAQRLHAIQTQDEERREEVFNVLAENNTWQVPTLSLTSMAKHQLYARDDWQETFKYLPESVRTEWEENARSMSEQSPTETELAHANWAYDVIPLLAEAGVGIMAGTDMPLVMQTPGFVLHEELSLLVRSGLTPMQAIEAATLRPAQYFGLENQQGAIAEGMLADLVLLNANPLDDITNTQEINAVMRDGHLHTRADLDEILAQLEEHGEVLSE